MKKAGRIGFQAGQRIKKGFELGIKGASKFQKKLGGIRTALLGLGVGAGIGKAFGDAAQLESVEARVENLTRRYGKFIGIQDKATQAAEKFRVSQTEALGDLVNLGSRLGGTSADLNDLVNVYEGFNTLLAVNKVSAQEAAGASLQLFQALGEGKLFTQEFNSLVSATPQLLDEVAKVMDVPRGKLKKLASDGEISADILIQALKNIRTEGGKELENTYKGAFGAQKEFNKALQEFSVVIGQELLPVLTPLLRSAAELLKFFGDLPGPIKTTAVAVGLLGTAALIAGPALGKLFAALAVAKLGAAAAGLGKIALAIKGIGIAAKFALGPWGLLAAGLVTAGIAIADYTTKQAKLKKLLEGESEDLGEYKEQIDATKTALRQAEKRLDEMITSGYDHEESIIAQKKEIIRLREELKKLIAQEYKVKVKIEYENFVNAKDVMIENFSMDKVNAILKAAKDEDKDKPTGSAPTPRKSKVPELQREKELELALTSLNKQQLDAQLTENSALIETLEKKKLVLQANKDIADIKASEVPNDEKLLEIDIRRARLQQELDGLGNQTAQRLQDEAKARDDIYKTLEDEIKLLDAQLAGRGDEERIAQEIKNTVKDIAGIDEDRVKDLVNMRTEREKELEQVQKLKEFYGQVAQRVGTALEDALVTTLDVAINKTKDLGEALQEIASTLLKDVGRMFLRAGISGIGKQWGIPGFAEGGYVTGPTPALIGEGGESEYVIPASKMDNAMNKYRSGSRGDAVLESGGSGDSGGVAVMDQPLSVSISGGVMQFGGEEFIRKDQLPSIIAQSSKAGEARTLARLRNNPGTRRKVGL